MRLFVAINLPKTTRDALYAAAAPLRDATEAVRWVAVDAVHLTLKFLGEVAAGRVDDVVGALERACRGARPFDLPIETFGAFPRPDRARVIWLGCEPVPPLELLQHGVEREFAGLGFPIEGRPFRPHLTLGRARADRAGLDLAGDLAALSYADAVTVERVDLMESTLGPGGARYAVRHSVTLVA